MFVIFRSIHLFLFFYTTIVFKSYIPVPLTTFVTDNVFISCFILLFYVILETILHNPCSKIHTKTVYRFVLSFYYCVALHDNVYSSVTFATFSRSKFTRQAFRNVLYALHSHSSVRLTILRASCNEQMLAF